MRLPFDAKVMKQPVTKNANSMSDIERFIQATPSQFELKKLSNMESHAR